MFLNLLISFFFLLNVCCTTAYSQSIIKGTVIDTQTKDPIPYVNIGCVKKGIGTVSGTDGSFTIKGLTQGDVLLFSSIGYRTVSRNIGSENNLDIKIRPEITMLEEVTISSDKVDRAKFKIQGEKIKKRSHSMGFGGKKLGTEIGALIKINKPYMVSKAVIPIDRIGENTSLKFRINIYDFSEGAIGSKLIDENIIVDCPETSGSLIIDLEKYNINLNDDVVLMLELIQGEIGKDDQNIMFRAKKGGDNIYWRQTSFASYSKLSDLVKGAPTLSIGFYLEGYEYKRKR